MARIEIDIEEYLDEVDDSTIVEEFISRGLSLKNAEVSVDKDLASDALGYLMARRHDRAVDAIRAVIAAIIPEHLLAAYEAAKEGRYSDAICELDHVIEPSPAATAKQLPFRPPSQPVTQ